MSKKGNFTISVDCMGGDNNTNDIITGVNRYYLENKTDLFLLHGDRTKINPILKQFSSLKKSCRLVHSEKTIGMEDKPAQTIRSGKNSSMWNAIESVKKSKADAIVSCGNTGSLMVLSTFLLRRLPNVKRPAIAIFWPSLSEIGFNIVLDAGADIKAQASDLLSFAKFGSEICTKVFNVNKPKIGLLNVGTETHKGNEQLRKAYVLLDGQSKKSDFIFAGFIEGSDLSSNKVNVVVTDGFTGNIALKTAEGTANLIKEFFKEEFQGSATGILSGLILKNRLKKLKERMDPRTANGGVFVGLNGLVIKSHGNSDSKSFYSALKLTKNLSTNDYY
jgi:glycerol-3-phosphate acyltransferase PlsX